MRSFFATVNCMAKYANTLGVFVANGLVNNEASLTTIPYLRAAVRDLKNHMALRKQRDGQRYLPIGYSAAPADSWSANTLCSDDSSTSVDFWGHIDYTNSTASQKDRLSTLKIPILLSEYSEPGSRPRCFESLKALYSPTFSGACVYEFWQSVNNYGLVAREGASNTGDRDRVAKKRERTGGRLLVLNDYVNLKKILKSIDQPELQAEDARGEERVSGTAASPEDVPQSCIDWSTIE